MSPVPLSVAQAVHSAMMMPVETIPARWPMQVLLFRPGGRDPQLIAAIPVSAARFGSMALLGNDWPHQIRRCERQPGCVIALSDQRVSLTLVAATPILGAV